LAFVILMLYIPQADERISKVQERSIKGTVAYPV
jgi:hypothetical protein